MKFADLFRRRRRDDVAVLRARFARFRHLLDMNTRVLRLVADADEKLGGEYLFDNQYLRTLEAELGESVDAAVRDLAEMSGNRYPRLASAVERVRAEVHACLEPHRVTGDVPLTLGIDQVGTDLAAAVGEKMARLGEIRRRLAMPVPDGFAITARACELLLARPRVASLLARYRTDRAGAEDLQAAIASAEPPAEVARAVKRALSRFGRRTRFAVRSSALGEDADVSFAGQHRTLLNVPREGVLTAWLQVVASLFSASASQYRRAHGLPVPSAEMAVGCLVMVPAAASGVIYSLDPNAPRNGAMIVSAVRGLGVPVVEGRGADSFRVSRQPPHELLASEVASREMWVAQPPGGVSSVPVPADLCGAPAVTPGTLARLAGLALRIERHMRCPQDIEWALEADGTIAVLQARPLRVGPEARPRTEEVLTARTRHRVLMQGRGEVACRGIGSGPVFAVRAGGATAGFVPGNVLVTEFASPDLAGLVAAASAFVSDAGSATGHLATVAREYRVPAIVGTGDATRRLSPGSVITVDADENTLYEGHVEELLRDRLLRSQPYEEAPEFRTLRRMLRHVSPLELRDPNAPNFTPQHCRSYHDIIRFAHERALLEFSLLEGIRLDGRHTSARPLALDVPLDLVVIDLGGGLAPPSGAGTISPGEVASRPLAVLVEGLLTPGVWSMNPAEMDLEGFMASATRAGPLTVPGSGRVRHNVAIVSADYLNLNLRVGYHFNIVDCRLGDGSEESYIFFRFVGGVTEERRRTRRARLLASILAKQGFKTELNGELVEGRLAGVTRAACEERLRMVGRLIGFSRQLDIALRDDLTVDRMTEEFLQSRYLVARDALTKGRDNADRH